MHKNTRIVLSLTAIALLCGATTIHAAPIEFTLEGIGSGELNDVVFTDEPFVITATGDTDNRTAFFNGFTIVNDAAQITFANLNGGAPIDFTIPTTLNANTEFDGISFGNDVDKNDIVLLFDPQLDGFELLTSLPTITAGGFLSDSGSTHQTSAGALFFNDSEPTLSFTATVIPEPTSLVLLGLGGVVLLRRNDRRDVSPEARARTLSVRKPIPQRRASP